MSETDQRGASAIRTKLGRRNAGKIIIEVNRSSAESILPGTNQFYPERVNSAWDESILTKGCRAKRQRYNSDAYTRSQVSEAQ